MSNTITLTGKASIEVYRQITIPSFFKAKYNTYLAIISAERVISIYHNKEYPSISITHPKNLLATRGLEEAEAMDELEFWSLFNEVKSASDNLITPYNIIPC